MQGGDTQDQNLLQFFLNVVEFGMNVQQAAEAANVNSYQMRSSLRRARFAARPPAAAGRTRRRGCARSWRSMGYTLESAEDRTSGPINAIYFDRKHGTLWGGSSDYGEDYGIAW